MGTEVTPPPPGVERYTPGCGKPFGFWKSLGLALAIYAVALYMAWLFNSFVQIVVVPHFLVLPEGPPPETPGWEMRLFRTGLFAGTGLCIQSVVGVFLLGFTMLQSEARARTYFGTARFKPIAIVTYLLPVVLLSVSAVAIRGIVTGSLVSSDWLALYRSAVPVYPLWIGIGILAPIYEELLFRGLLYRGMLQTCLGVKGTVVLSAVIWAATHFRYGVVGVLVLFFGGLLLGAARHRSRSISLPILMHATWNLLSLTSCALEMLIE